MDILRWIDGTGNEGRKWAWVSIKKTVDMNNMYFTFFSGVVDVG